MTTLAPPKPALTDVRCNGTRKNGRPCREILFRAGPGEFNVLFEFRCDACGKIHYFGPLASV